MISWRNFLLARSLREIYFHSTTKGSSMITKLIAFVIGAGISLSASAGLVQ
jgi:hypothetical protein